MARSTSRTAPIDASVELVAAAESSAGGEVIEHMREIEAAALEAEATWPSPTWSSDSVTPSGGGKAPKKTDDQKRADFSRLASARASAALKAMITLGSLANTAQYLWNADQEEALIGALDAKVVELGDMFAAARAPSGGDGRRRPKQLLIKV